MAAFSGYCVQSNGFHWPWAMTMDGGSFDMSGSSPPEQWDAIPLNAKLQIVAFVGGGRRRVRPGFGLDFLDACRAGATRRRLVKF